MIKKIRILELDTPNVSRPFQDFSLSSLVQAFGPVTYRLRNELFKKKCGPQYINNTSIILEALVCGKIDNMFQSNFHLQISRLSQFKYKFPLRYITHILYVQEGLTHFIYGTFCIQWVKTSWTYCIQ